MFTAGTKSQPETCFVYHNYCYDQNDYSNQGCYICVLEEHFSYNWNISENWNLHNPKRVVKLNLLNTKVLHRPCCEHAKCRSKHIQRSSTYYLVSLHINSRVCKKQRKYSTCQGCNHTSYQQ